MWLSLDSNTLWTNPRLEFATMRLKDFALGAVFAGGMAAGALGLTAATAGASPMPAPAAPAAPAPAPAPPPPAPPAGPHPVSAPAWAPPKPVDPSWADGNKQVWDAGWNHWGVWMNGVFVPTF